MFTRRSSTRGSRGRDAASREALRAWMACRLARELNRHDRGRKQRYRPAVSRARSHAFVFLFFDKHYREHVTGLYRSPRSRRKQDRRQGFLARNKSYAQRRRSLPPRHDAHVRSRDAVFVARVYSDGAHLIHNIATCGGLNPPPHPFLNYLNFDYF